ncbi:lipoprotein LipL31 [Leptospira sp. 85282-16]|uniref:Lipoprotein LipL31 n=1 Tax=Leptospira montravelensis TaxID=2484961 RepID=A0ABY2LXY6_9LEPT|nr:MULTISPECIES: lipoprotein LipL31 [Leptospira]MCT8332419.1 lipoprotein LipL31 [Leptospira sp. 85282-16]TGK83645.1 lipoprotein LipL31 [Leptospira montravelensis]TGL05647.1 lipoprotein LipL31 [Leptospira montravelensis]
MTKILPLFVFLASLFLVQCSDSSPVIETLDNHKITVKDFEAAYDTALDSISRLQNIEKKTLLEFIEKDINEVPQNFQDLNYQLQKKNFYQTYRQMIMTRLVAEKNGYISRPDVAEVIKQVEMQTIAQMYVSEQVEKKIQITDEQAKAECERLRGLDRNIANLTIDKCLTFAKAQLKQLQTREQLPLVVERIKEEVTIKRNDKFDLDAYLAPKKKVEEPSNQPK